MTLNQDALISLLWIWVSLLVSVSCLYLKWEQIRSCLKGFVSLLSMLTSFVRKLGWFSVLMSCCVRELIKKCFSIISSVFPDHQKRCLAESCHLDGCKLPWQMALDVTFANYKGSQSNFAKVAQRVEVSGKCQATDILLQYIPLKRKKSHGRENRWRDGQRKQITPKLYMYIGTP